MPDQLEVSQFSSLFSNDYPLLDVRAPTEFKRGAFPFAHNIPLLEDKERQAVGRRFREAGQDAAITLGEELISGEVRNDRIQRWRQFASSHPNTVIYCFRGGLRSQIVQDWLRDEGMDIPRINGGYKAMRRYCINTIEHISKEEKYVVIGGKTGSAKTHLLEQLKFSVDLEGLARHRGSAFGRRCQGQPSQIDFENQLAIAVIKQKLQQANKIFIEDESKAIGSLSVPLSMHQQMSRSPLAIIEASFESRVETILNDFIFSNRREFESTAPDHYVELFSDSLLSALLRIRRRLGEEHFSSIKSLMENALRESNEEQSSQLHRDWITKLLKDYYDPMYEYQLSKKSHRIVFRGNKAEFLNWAKAIDRSL